MQVVDLMEIEILFVGVIVNRPIGKRLVDIWKLANSDFDAETRRRRDSTGLRLRRRLRCLGRAKALALPFWVCQRDRRLAINRGFEDAEKERRAAFSFQATF